MHYSTRTVQPIILAVLIVLGMFLLAQPNHTTATTSLTHESAHTASATTIDLSSTTLDKVPDLSSPHLVDSKSLLWLNVYKFSMKQQGLSDYAIAQANEAVRVVYRNGVTLNTDKLADLWWTTYKFSMLQQGVGSHAVLAADSVVEAATK